MANEKILVVDDEPDILEYCSVALGSAGYTVCTAEGAHRAVQMARAEAFDVLLTDIRMPDMDGLATFRAIREFDTDIAGIAMTGYGSMDTAIRALELGFSCFLTKPFTIGELTSAVERTLEKAHLERENARLKALINLHELAAAGAQGDDLRGLLTTTLQIALDETRSDAASIELSEEATGLNVRRLRLPAETEESRQLAAAERFISNWVTQMRTGRIFSDHSTETSMVRDHLHKAGLASSICLPLMTAGEIIGTLSIHRRVENAASRFSEADFKAATVLCAHAAAAVVNAQLQRQLYQDRAEVVRSLATAIEARMPYAVGHSDRVSEYAALLAAKLGLPGAERELVRIAGALHNIGMVGIDETVLLAPGPLDEEQREELRRHPAVGAKMIQAAGLPEAVRAAVYHHHERYDGAGYPDGLRGADIPLASRILAVADTFAACRANRPHRTRMSSAAALRLLTSVAGAQLDPDLVASFVELMPEVANTDGAYTEHEAEDARPDADDTATA